MQVLRRTNEKPEKWTLTGRVDFVSPYISAQQLKNDDSLKHILSENISFDYIRLTTMLCIHLFTVWRRYNSENEAAEKSKRGEKKNEANRQS